MAVLQAGSQLRELIAESGYELVAEFYGGLAILRDTISNKLEVWQANDDFAGYVVVLDGVGYEFVREVTGDDNAAWDLGKKP